MQRHCWRGYLSGVRCRLAYGRAGATVSCFSKIEVGFTFLVPAHLGVVLDIGPLNGCVCNVQADDSRQTVANDRAADGEHSLLHQETGVVTSWWMD